MQHEVGIRGAGARFVLPGSSLRGMRAGSLGLIPVRAPLARGIATTAATQPVRAVRLAARSLVRPSTSSGARGRVLATPYGTRWNPPRSRLRDPRGAATPWRG